MNELAQLDLALQDEFARPAHWAEPASKLRRPRPAPKLDYRAWLDHAAGCTPCGLARDDLLALRTGDLEVEPAVPCARGMALVPLEDVDRAAGGLDRGELAMALRRIAEWSRQREDWGPEARMSAGQAWGRVGQR